MRIAVVGSGIAGLVVAHLLHDDHDITLFERNDYIGGHTNTVDIPGVGRRLAVDTGFIVFNERTYPHFMRLLSRLGVASQPTSMSFSVRCPRTGLEYNGSTLNQLFAQRRNLLRPSFLRMLAEILRFNRRAPRVLGTEAETQTLEAYLRAEGYGRAFREHYLVPMGSAIWSMPPRRLLAFPLGFFVRFFHNHGMLTVDDRPQWLVVRGGSRTYVEAIVHPFRDRVRTGRAVRRVARFPDRVEVDGEPFDEVVLACHSDEALSLLADPTPAERTILGALPYQANEAVLHTDASLLPRRRRAWAAWNYLLGADADAPASVTYDMNILQALEAAETYCVTLNRGGAVDADRVLARMDYAHPVYTQEGIAAQHRHTEISGVNRTHYCGAYWGYGFHEDGVNSALAVARRFGKTL